MSETKPFHQKFFFHETVYFWPICKIMHAPYFLKKYREVDIVSEIIMIHPAKVGIVSFLKHIKASTKMIGYCKSSLMLRDFMTLFNPPVAKKCILCIAPMRVLPLDCRCMPVPRRIELARDIKCMDSGNIPHFEILVHFEKSVAIMHGSQCSLGR